MNSKMQTRKITFGSVRFGEVFSMEDDEKMETLYIKALYDADSGELDNDGFSIGFGVGLSDGMPYCPKEKDLVNVKVLTGESLC